MIRPHRHGKMKFNAKKDQVLYTLCVGVELVKNVHKVSAFKERIKYCVKREIGIPKLKFINYGRLLCSYDNNGF